MADRTRDGLAGASGARRVPRRASRPRVEGLEGRALLATLAPIADFTAPTGLGLQLPLEGGSAGPQTFAVRSDNPAVGASVAQGNFLTVGVRHESSGAGDPAFTGSLTFQLFGDLTPLTVQRIEQLVNQGFYTSPTTGNPPLPSKNFHRIASGFPGPNDFIVQGGSQNGTGSGSLSEPGYPFADEFNRQLAFTGRGQLAMANAGDDTNDSQFFITTGSPRFLDFQHNIFGQLVEGEETLQRMTQVARGGQDGQTPVNPILITATTLSPASPDGVVHLDLTGAAAGQSANVTVTARDASGGEVARTFRVNVGPNVDASGQPIIERPFLANTTPNQVVGLNQTAVFQLNAVSPTPGDPLTYGVGGGVTTGTNPTFSPVTNGTATVDANGVVRVTPTQGFTGVISLLVGVRDQTNRLGTGQTIENIGNYDTQRISLTVNNGQFVNLKPIALTVNATVGDGESTTVQLAGDTANPNSPSQTLQYSLLSAPSNGTVSNFDATTGTFTYTPNADFFGTDSLTYQVRDVGDPTPNLESDAATVTITVGGAQTGAVRVIDRVLVVTPLPASTIVEKRVNTILVNRVGNAIQVRINGVLDANQPDVADLDRIVVYGSKASDTVRVGREVQVPTTLDGGHGGVNLLTAGGASSTMFGWFRRRNVLKGGPANDRLSGRVGLVKFVRSGGNDQLFAGEPRLGHRNRSAIFPGKQFGAKPQPPRGTFYKFIGKTLVPIREV